jgi:hypothetical protein
MATQVSETENTTTRKLITGYVRYNKDENIESTISTLRSFNAKYTHHVGYVFFSLDQQRLSDLSTQLKFRISRFESKSEYTCPSDVATQITDQRDSFLRVHYHTDRNVLEFLSRTTSSVHYSLVLRLFKRAGVEFHRENYTSYRPERQQTRMRRQDTEGDLSVPTVDQTTETQQEQQQETQETREQQEQQQSQQPRRGVRGVRGSRVVREGQMGKAKYSREGRQQFRQQQQQETQEGGQVRSRGGFRGRGRGRGQVAKSE